MVGGGDDVWTGGDGRGQWTPYIRILQYSTMLYSAVQLWRTPTSANIIFNTTEHIAVIIRELTGESDSCDKTFNNNDDLSVLEPLQSLPCPGC